MKMMSVMAVLLLLPALAAAQKLPFLNIDKAGITASGVSAGGAMAIQFHVAFSEGVSGVGIFAGPPYFCAQCDVEIALSSCTKDPDLIILDDLFAATEYAAFTANSIDDPKGIKDDKVWIFTGKVDSVVHPGVLNKTHSYYEHYTPKTAIKFIDTFDAEHAWITDKFGNDCTFLGVPYINNCGFDAAGDMLQHLYGQLNNRTSSLSGNMSRFDQRYYTPVGVLPPEISLGEVGYLYTPSSCGNGTLCKLHVAFHGCNQDLTSIGTDFVYNTGILEWADVNDMVVLFPQAIKSPEIPYNPQGCFDWWGFSGVDYACRYGPQMATFANMVRTIAGSFE